MRALFLALLLAAPVSAADLVMNMTGATVRINPSPAVGNTSRVWITKKSGEIVSGCDVQDTKIQIRITDQPAQCKLKPGKAYTLNSTGAWVWRVP